MAAPDGIVGGSVAEDQGLRRLGETERARKRWGPAPTDERGRGVRALVDRRLYRDKYDVRKTLGEFDIRLCDETNPEALGGELLAIVQDTSASAHALLLRSSADADTREDSRS